ncbi:hypothetical protein CVT26_002321 [Gymnopilus dilepis]|uniref:Rhodopsin domain-containing protein n=1 Tax=Gymnopilus dilepis TaxID=231916 RepID=A0A409Y3N0_9AGAR|nr:hypothetical protein CVT26_002321 [Gymnopilus dilepis]
MDMRTLPPQNYLPWRGISDRVYTLTYLLSTFHAVILSALNLLGIVCAAYRLLHRYLIKRLWWDDYVVIIPLFLSLIYWPLFLVDFPYRLGLDVATASLRDRILNSFWLSFLPFILIVRLARIALALSLARIFPEGHRARRWSFFLVGLFSLQCITCIVISVVAAFMLLTKSPYEAWSFLSVWSRSSINVLELNLAAFDRRHILRFPSSCVSSCALLAAQASLQRTTINFDSILRKCLDYFNCSGLCITQFEYTSILGNRLAVPNPGPASSGGESNPKNFNSGFHGIGSLTFTRLQSHSLSATLPSFLLKITRLRTVETRPLPQSAEEATHHAPQIPCSCTLSSQSEEPPTTMTLTEISSVSWPTDPSLAPSRSTAPVIPFVAVPISILYSVSIACAIYRIFQGYVIKRLWWDDYTAIIPPLLSLVFWPLFLVSFPYRLGGTIIPSLAFFALSHNCLVGVSQASLSTRVLNSFWLTFLPFILIVRFARISISLSLARVFPSGHPVRRWCLFLVSTFAMWGLACIVIAMASCPQTSALFATSVRGHHCVFVRGSIPLRSLFLLIGNDLLLVISPLLFFWRLKLPSRERRLILIVSSASVLTTLSVVAYASIAGNPNAQGVDWLFLLQGLRHIEAGVSVLVCNLAVVSTCIYQKLVKALRREPEATAPEGTKETTQQPPLTQCSCTFSSHSEQASSSSRLTLTQISTLSSSVSVLYSIAIACAFYRLLHRYLIKRLWWDDYVVIVPLVLSLVYWPAFLLRIPYRLGVNISQAPFSIQVLSSFWFTYLPFILIVRFSRIAIALSLARVFPGGHPVRRWCFFLVGLFTLLGASCLIITVASCKQSSVLFVSTVRGNSCIYVAKNLPLKSLTILIDDFGSDCLLVVFSLHFFWRLRLPPKERRLILIVSCASVLTTLAVVAYATIAGNPDIQGVDWLLIIQGLRHIEAGVSLLVCNLAVVSTCMYQRLMKVFHQERPQLESTQESRQHSREHHCSCTLSNYSEESLSTMTLTEISSSMSSNTDLSLLESSPSRHSASTS